MNKVFYLLLNENNLNIKQFLIILIGVTFQSKSIKIFLIDIDTTFSH